MIDFMPPSRTSALTSRRIGQNPVALRQLILPSVLLLCVILLSFHAITGERGYLALFDLSAQTKKEHETLATLKFENEKLLRNIKLLSGDTLDKDFLDERVREVLGFAYQDETVLILR